MHLGGWSYTLARDSAAFADELREYVRKYRCVSSA